MTRCRARGEIGKARRRDEQPQCRFGCSVRRLLFSQVFAPATQFAGRSESQGYCLALESSPLARSYL